jgi:hypothetical protein
VLIPGLAYVIVPGIVIVAALLVFYLTEWLTYVILQLARRIRPPAPPPTAQPKAVNRPQFRWTL